MEAICSSETLVFKRAMQCSIPGDGIMHSHHCKNPKSYIENISFLLFLNLINNAFFSGIGYGVSNVDMMNFEGSTCGLFYSTIPEFIQRD
jgi:hypothetical protein